MPQVKASIKHGLSVPKRSSALSLFQQNMYTIGKMVLLEICHVMKNKLDDFEKNVPTNNVSANT